MLNMGNRLHFSKVGGFNQLKSAFFIKKLVYTLQSQSLLILLKMKTKSGQSKPEPFELIFLHYIAQPITHFIAL